MRPRVADAEAYKTEQEARNIALMVGKGWIESKRAGRAQMLRLTPAGSAVLASAFPAWQRAQRHAERLLSGDAVEMLRQVSGPAAAGPESDTGHAQRRG
jgi:DNA-binding MarR family transcriptional regulator